MNNKAKFVGKMDPKLLEFTQNTLCIHQNSIINQRYVLLALFKYDGDILKTSGHAD